MIKICSFSCGFALVVVCQSSLGCWQGWAKAGPKSGRLRLPAGLRQQPKAGPRLGQGWPPCACCQPKIPGQPCRPKAGPKAGLSGQTTFLLDKCWQSRRGLIFLCVFSAFLGNGARKLLDKCWQSWVVPQPKTEL